MMTLALYLLSLACITGACYLAFGNVVLKTVRIVKKATGRWSRKTTWSAPKKPSKITVIL